MLGAYAEDVAGNAEKWPHFVEVNGKRIDP
jgi:hypothetical protein